MDALQKTEIAIPVGKEAIFRMFSGQISQETIVYKISRKTAKWTSTRDKGNEHIHTVKS